jgi:hypothetical protein
MTPGHAQAVLRGLVSAGANQGRRAMPMPDEDVVPATQPGEAATVVAPQYAADSESPTRHASDPTRQASPAELGPASIASPGLAPAPLVETSTQTRFRILRAHARGGLGQVSVALDQEWNREVALKEIQPQHADAPLSRERFVLEAQITGGLEHPGRRDESVKQVELLLERAGESSTARLQAARCFAICAQFEPDADQKRRFTERALESLATAVGADFADRLLLTTDSELAPLRGEATFQTILEKVHGPSIPQ